MASTRRAKIRSIVRKHYGKSVITRELARQIDRQYEDLTADKYSDKLVDMIWRWVSGGRGTATSAGAEIRKAVDD